MGGGGRGGGGFRGDWILGEPERMWREPVEDFLGESWRGIPVEPPRGRLSWSQRGSRGVALGIGGRWPGGSGAGLFFLPTLVRVEGGKEQRAPSRCMGDGPPMERDIRVESLDKAASLNSSSSSSSKGFVETGSCGVLASCAFRDAIESFNRWSVRED